MTTKANGSKCFIDSWSMGNNAWICSACFTSLDFENGYQNNKNRVMLNINLYHYVEIERSHCCSDKSKTRISFHTHTNIYIYINLCLRTRADLMKICSKGNKLNLRIHSTLLKIVSAVNTLVCFVKTGWNHYNYYLLLGFPWISQHFCAGQRDLCM